MATQDTAGKWYMSDNAIFADAFNFLLYDGEPVIKPGLRGLTRPLRHSRLAGRRSPFGSA